MERLKLRDGSQIAIRPIEPTDRGLLADGFARLSPESRYRRFFAPVPQLSERELDYLTRVDHHDHEALVAVDADTGAGVGVARFVRVGEGQAEPAMAVVDDWHGRGVATALLDALVQRAREEGVERFVAPVLAGNRDAIGVLSRLGRTTSRPAGAEVELDIELGPDVEHRLRALRFLRQFATGAARPARTVIDRVVPQRRGHLDDPRGNRIVVGVDGSPGSVAAARVAAELAATSHAGVHVVGVHRLMLGEAERVREAVAETAGALRDRGLQVYEHVLRGEPGPVLADVAEQEGARLIVVGAAHRALGSTADAVAHRAPCDVLIARARAE